MPYPAFSLISKFQFRRQHGRVTHGPNVRRLIARRYTALSTRAGNPCNRPLEAERWVAAAIGFVKSVPQNVFGDNDGRSPGRFCETGPPSSHRFERHTDGATPCPSQTEPVIAPIHLLDVATVLDSILI
jgi:hypothetical protein